MKKIIVLVFFSILSFSSLQADEAKKAPDFILMSTEGNLTRLSQFYGQPVMLNIWATWGTMSRKEMPLLSALYDDNADSGFTILSVNMWDSRAEVDAWLKEYPVSFPVLMDTKKILDEHYKVLGFPTSVFIDCQGNVSDMHAGYQTGDEVKHIERLQALVESCDM